MTARPVPFAAPALKRAAAVLALVAVAACSRDLPAQAAGTASPAAAPAPAAAGAAPAPDVAVRALPDFSQLVDRYGPAVVNVEVVQKPKAAGGIQGLSPNDPFFDFFRRFGIPAPQQQPRAPVRGAGSG